MVLRPSAPHPDLSRFRLSPRVRSIMVRAVTTTAARTLVWAPLLAFALLTGCEDVRLDVPLLRPDAEPARDVTLIDSGQVVAVDSGGMTEADAGFPDATELDSGPAPMDAGALDTGLVADAGTPDSGPADTGTADTGVPPVTCSFEVFGPADRERVVLVAEPFSDTPGVDGTSVRVLRLDLAGELHVTDTRVDVGFRPARIEIVPSGEYAIVLGEDGELASVAISSTMQVTLVDVVSLPAAGYGDLRILADGRTIVVAGSNSDASSGLSTATLACDGSLTVDTAAFYALRLTSSFDWTDEAETRAVVLGGQAVFAPIDNDDIRLFSRQNGTFTQIAAFDLWSDHVDAERIAVSPDGRTLLVPNGSPFSTQGSTVMVATITGNTIGGARILQGMGDAREAMFSVDGRTALISILQPSGSIAVLADQGMGFVEVSRIRGIGLAEQLAQLRRGMLSGLVLAPSVDPNGGPNVARVRITGPGAVSYLGQTELGPDIAQIPGGIAIQP